MVSLFAFITVLGIVVDDAIVVSENIMTYRTKNYEPVKSAKIGTFKVATPVVYAVLTTVAAFAPLAFVEGRMGQMMANVPVVVVPVLLFSLYESLFILPTHLSHLKNRVKGQFYSKNVW